MVFNLYSRKLPESIFQSDLGQLSLVSDVLIGSMKDFYVLLCDDIHNIDWHSTNKVLLLIHFLFWVVVQGLFGVSILTQI